MRMSRSQWEGIGKVAGWIRTAGIRAIVPDEFLVGRPDFKEVWIELSGKIEVSGLTNPDSKNVQNAFHFVLDDTKKKWHNGVKRLLNLPMPLDKRFNEWASSTFMLSIDAI